VSKYGFENLVAWQKSVVLVEMSYALVKLLPRDEKTVLIDQLRRASTSVPLNIAEGSIGKNPRVYMQFLEIAHRSLYETVAILKIIERLYKINVAKELDMCDEVSKTLSGLKNWVASNRNPQGFSRNS
jgi:four helix bundle protein